MCLNNCSIVINAKLNKENHCLHHINAIRQVQQWRNTKQKEAVTVESTAATSYLSQLIHQLSQIAFRLCTMSRVQDFKLRWRPKIDIYVNIKHNAAHKYKYVQ